MARLVLRRGLHVPDYSKPLEHAQKPVKFAEVAMHGMFTLHPSIYSNFTLIKVGPRRCELYSWDDRVHATQYLPEDTMVYPLTRPTMPPVKP